jgi:hypothetical protein
MRAAVIVVSMLVVATPSEASKSCMSKTEARQHFGSVHIYWHGPSRCWDATPTRRRHQIRKVQEKIDQSKWHDAMSELLPDEPAQPPWINRWVDIEPAPIVSRWVDIAQVVPPSIISKPEPIVTPRGVVMVIIVLTLTFAVVTIYQRPTSRGNTPSAG